MAAPARSNATQSAAPAPAPQKAPSPVTPKSNVTPSISGAPFVRVASRDNTPLAQRPKVVPVATAPVAAAGHGQPALTVTGPGEPLAKDVRSQLESGFGADLSAVRVHKGPDAARLAFAQGARAFAYGHHVVLGEKESSRDVALMAHEVAHVLQQRGSSTVQRCSGGVCTCGGKCGGGSAAEAEAARAAATVSSGGNYSVTGHAPSGAQHAPEEDEGWFEGKIWGLLNDYAPDLVPIIRKGPVGVLDWIKDRVSGAVQRFFDTVMAPVKSIANVGKSLHAHVAPLLTSIQEAAARIAQNDCKPLTDAAAKIEDVAAKFITPIIEKLQEVVGKVGDFLKGVWDKFGMPVWDFIKKYYQTQWELLKKLGEWIWDKTAPVRKLADRAWTWLKNKIGIGEGPEGQNGILQWIEGKLGTAWDWIQKKIEPYKKQITTVLTVVGGIAIMISPAGPIIIAGAAIYGVIQAVKWIRANMAGGNAIVRAREHAQKVLIPQLMAQINKVTGAITKMANTVSGKLGDFSASIGKIVGAAASSALQFLVDAAQWLADKAVELATWATEKLNGLADWITKAFERLRTFLQPVLDFFIKVGGLIVDIYGLPFLLAGALWKKIPACIRDPFVDWIIPLILRQIDIFKELVKDTEAWQKTKADVMNIIKLVFVNKDLQGAIKAVFHLILRVFNVPYDLLVKVVQKAQVAWDVVVSAPIKFLKNAVRTMGRGLMKYWDHLWDNLLFGIEGWLFGELAEKGITKPKSWTDPWALMGFALEIMGLSMPHIFELMEKADVPKPFVDVLRGLYAGLSKAWDWIMNMKDKKPAEVTAEIITAAKEFGKSILEGIVTWIVEQVSIELAEMAAAAAASAGLSEVLDAVRRIYRAIKTAVRWMRTVLEMVNTALDSVLQIAKGDLDPAAGLLEGAMKKATPAIIGFLGDQVGLGGIADEIKSIIDKLRKKVDDAIIAVIKAIKSLIMSLASGAKELAKSVFDWWKQKLGLKGADGKPHKLYFQGERENAEPFIQSDAKAVADFIKEIGRRPEGKKNPAAQHITTVQGHLDTIKKERKRPKSEEAKANAAIEKAFTAMVKPLEALLGRGEVGTKDNPLEMDYPKPKWNTYPTVYVGPESDRRIPQSLLAAGDETDIRKLLYKRESDAWDGKIKKYEPSARSQTLPNGDVHPGIAAQYRTAKNLLIELHPGNTQGGSKVNKFFRPYGYRAAEEDSNESKDGDHIVEMQLGGPNELNNLWPLSASLNRSGGSRTASMAFGLPDGPITMDELKKRADMIPTWLKIKSTL